jgi:hypothetical protein
MRTSPAIMVKHMYQPRVATTNNNGPPAWERCRRIHLDVMAIQTHFQNPEPVAKCTF